MKYAICAYFRRHTFHTPPAYKFPDGYLNSDYVFGNRNHAMIFDNVHDASLALRYVYQLYGTEDYYCIHVVE